MQGQPHSVNLTWNSLLNNSKQEIGGRGTVRERKHYETNGSADGGEKQGHTFVLQSGSVTFNEKMVIAFVVE